MNSASCHMLQTEKRERGIWTLSIKSYGPAPPPSHHHTHPITFIGYGREYMVQIGAPSAPECQEGVQSPGGQPREEHWVVHHIQVEHYQGHF